MKKITLNTKLTQNNNIFFAIEVDGIIYWIDEVKRNSWHISPTYEKGIKNGVETIFFDESYFEGYGHDFFGSKSIVAQSQPKLEGVPIISLDNYIQRLANLFAVRSGCEYREDLVRISKGVIHGYKSTPNQYTQKDIEKALSLAFMASQDGYDITTKEILEQINQISEIIVDEQFNIISYE